MTPNLAEAHPRRALALANWKMAMTVAEGMAFLRDFRALAGETLNEVDVVICPPFTSIWALAQALHGRQVELGAQDLAAAGDTAQTGQVSAALLAEAGCRWALLGHWEVRRQRGDDDALVNRKIVQALRAGLQPIVTVGEPAHSQPPRDDLLADQLERLLEGCQAEEAGRVTFLYEPESAIGASQPVPPGQAAHGCSLIRSWLAERHGHPVAQGARIIYGGSVSPEHAASLLAHPDVDGLGAGRMGREAVRFAQIVRTIAQVKRTDPQ